MFNALFKRFESVFKSMLCKILAKVGDLTIDSDQISVISKIENNLIFFTPLLKIKMLAKAK